MYGVSPFFFLILGFIVSLIAGIANQDQELFLILMGLFSLCAFIAYHEQNKDLEDENKSLRGQINNQSFPSSRRKKRRKKKK